MEGQEEERIFWNVWHVLMSYLCCLTSAMLILVMVQSLTDVQE